VVREFTTSWVLAMMHFYRFRRSPCVNASDHAEPGHAVRSTSGAFESNGSRAQMLSLLFVFACFNPLTIWAQCAGITSSPGAASDCAAHAIPADTVAKLDPAHPYTLAELIDIAGTQQPSHAHRLGARQAEGRRTGHREKCLLPGACRSSGLL
jgi:hypothetical protein